MKIKFGIIVIILLLSFSDAFSQQITSFIKKVYPNSPDQIGSWIKGKTFVVLDNGEVVMFNEVDDAQYNQNDRVPYLYKTDNLIYTQQANYLVGNTGVSYQRFDIKDAIQLSGGGFAFCGEYLGPTATVIQCKAAFIYTVDDQLNDVSFSFYPYSLAFNSLKQTQSGDFVVVGESLDEAYYNQYSTAVLKPSILLLEQDAPHNVLSAVILNDNAINYTECIGALNYVIKVAEEHEDGECFISVGRIVAESQSFNPTRKSGLIVQFTIGGNTINVIENQVYHSSGIGDEEVESDFISICQGGLNSYYIVSNISCHPYYSFSFNSIGHIHLHGNNGSVLNLSVMTKDYIVNSGYYGDNVFAKSITCSNDLIDDNGYGNEQLSTGFMIDIYTNIKEGYILGTKDFFAGNIYYKKYDAVIVNGGSGSGNVMLNKILIDQNNQNFLAYGDFEDLAYGNSSYIIIGDNFSNLVNNICSEKLDFYPVALPLDYESVDVIQIIEGPYCPPRGTFTCNPDEDLPCGTNPSDPVFTHPYYLAASVIGKRVLEQSVIEGDILQIMPNKEFGSILIFSIEGKLLHTIRSYSEMENLRLPNGMYILRSGQSARKFVIVN